MKDNVIDFRSTQKKNRTEKPQKDFDLTLARQIVERDPDLRKIVETMGVSLDDAARWLVLLSGFQYSVELAAYEALEAAGHHPAFGGLVSQALANEASDQLTTVGMNMAVTKDMFAKLQKNAIQALLQARHIDDLMSDDFQNFEGDPK